RLGVELCADGLLVGVHAAGPALGALVVAADLFPGRIAISARKPVESNAELVVRVIALHGVAVHAVRDVQMAIRRAAARDGFVMVVRDAVDPLAELLPWVAPDERVSPALG